MTSETKSPQRFRLRLDEQSLLLLVLLLSSWLPASGPLQLIAYLAPITVVGVAVLLRRIALSRLVVIFLIALAAVNMLSVLLGADEFLPLNLALAYFTHASVLILVIKFRRPEHDYVRLINAVAWLSLLQVVLSAAQIVVATGSLLFVTKSAGDFAVGTLLTNSHLFSAKMLLHFHILIIAHAHGFRQPLVRVGLLASLLGAAFGSALFLTGLYVAGLILALFMVPWRVIGQFPAKVLNRLRLLSTCTFVLFAAAFMVLQSDNVRYGVNVASTIPKALAEEPESQYGKIDGTIRSIRLVASDPTLLFFGTGLGHYSSRAALILTGGYLRNHPPSIPISLTKYSEQNIVPLWNPEIWKRRFHDGVLNQPFYSMQSLAVEVGLTGIVVVVFFYTAMLYCLGRKNTITPGQRSLQLTALSLLVVLPVILLSENWLEYPHLAIPIWLALSLGLSLPKREGVGASAKRRPCEPGDVV